VAQMDGTRSTTEKGSAFEIIASADDDFGAGYKICKGCGENKPLEEFRVEAKGVQGRKAVCKNCNNTPTIKSPKKGSVRNDMIKAALEAAAYRIIKESM